MADLEIKPASGADPEWCARLMASTDPWITLRRGYEDCLARCRHPEYLLYVARAGAEPCGFLLLHPRGVAGSPYVASIAVAESWRSRGVGRSLMEFAERLFSGGSRHLFLCVSSFNSRARALYEQLGYEAVAELKDYVIEGASEALMHKRLTPK